MFQLWHCSALRCNELVLRWEKQRRSFVARLSRWVGFHTRRVSTLGSWVRVKAPQCSSRERRREDQVSQQLMRNLPQPVRSLWLLVLVECFLLFRFHSLRVFFPLFFMTTGFSCQWECKGSFSRVSDLTRLTKETILSHLSQKLTD